MGCSMKEKHQSGSQENRGHGPSPQPVTNPFLSLLRLLGPWPMLLAPSRKQEIPKSGAREIP